MLKICALVALLGVANGGLIGSERCTWGPSYWCENFKQAVECGATEHCHKNVWSKLTKPTVVDSTDACTFCKDMVSDVRNFLESNQTQTTVLEYLNKACDIFPDEYGVAECKKIEQHYLDLFEKCVQDHVDPDAICKLCRLCSTSSHTSQKDLIKAPAVIPSQLTRVSLKSSALGLRAKDEPLCDACKSFVDLAKKDITDPKIQAAITAMVKAECKKMSGTTELECEAAVDVALPQVFKIVAEELTDQLCVSAGLCTSSAMSTALAAAATKERLRAAIYSNAVRESMQKAASGLEAGACDTCEMIAGYAKIFLSNNATEAELQQYLTDNVCPQLGEFSDMCKTLVEEYVPQIYAALLNFLDPATICTDLGLCSTTAAPPTTPATAVKKERARSSIQCVICEFVLTKLDSMISDNATQEEIIHAVEKVCSILPSTVTKECDDLIEKYGKAIIELIVNDVSPSVICGFLGLCSSGDSRYKLPLPQGDELCSMCETVMSYLVSILKENATKAEIIQELERVCNFLSGQLAGECNSAVDTYGPAIINLLADNMKPGAVCTALTLCPANTYMKVDGLVHLYKSHGNY